MDRITTAATATDVMLMSSAMAQARAAGERGEVPVGAAIADSNGRFLVADGNRIMERADPTAHAELLVVREAARILGSERLVGTTLATTLEPCAMCAGALSLARVARVVFAAEDPKGGAVLHGPKFFQQRTCHHRPAIVRLEDQADAAGDLLRAFFKARRAGR